MEVYSKDVLELKFHSEYLDQNLNLLTLHTKDFEYQNWQEQTWK